MAKHDDPLETINHRWGGRFLSTGRIAGSALRLASRRLRGAQAGQTDGAIGERLARELDGMKGLAMKVGQILSYFDGILPEETHAALRSLQAGSRAVDFAVMREVLEAELGGRVESLFEAFDETPVASASIGQVYRARYDGRAVAVKVQYPHVQETFRSDFGRIRKLAKLASLATAVDGPAIADELAERIGEECDYRREAAFQTAFAKAFSWEPRIQIPDVVEARSAERVITSTWCEGRDFYSFVESSTGDQRNAAGLLLARFAFTSLFRLGTLNADPHPGNYLFPEGDAVVFLDFGCIRHFAPEILEVERELVRVVIEDRREAFRDALLATGIVAKPRRFDFDVHWAMLCHQYAPYRAPHFRFSMDYIREGMAFNRPSNPNLRKLAIPPYWIWLQRLHWGLHAVLARLQAEGDFRQVLCEALQESESSLEKRASISS